MTVHTPSPDHGKRRRRAHQKSRKGCGNCKLRRVKCDETQPRCEKCTSFGVTCNYDSTPDELQLAMKGSFVILAPQKSPVSLNQTILNRINTSLRLQSHSETTPLIHELCEEDLRVVNKFQSRTLLTIGTKETVHIYKNEWFRIACQHPMLMHVVLAMTIMHDRYLSGFAETPQSVTEAYHHYEGIKLFHRALSKPIKPSEKDALWASAALLSVLSFASIDARTYEEAWPLKAPSVSDLDWLRMTDGKKAVWKLADPMRRGSVIREAWTSQQSEAPHSTQEPKLRSCPIFLELYDLDEDLAGEDNPYCQAVSLLMPLLEIECNHSTIAKFLSFIGHNSAEYRRLLGLKDPQALLLLAYWYGKLCQYDQWWNKPRAVLECRAICVYLERYHSHETRIQMLSHFPKAMCGLGAE
jgi:hypothetical protein